MCNDTILWLKHWYPQKKSAQESVHGILLLGHELIKKDIETKPVQVSIYKDHQLLYNDHGLLFLTSSTRAPPYPFGVSQFSIRSKFKMIIKFPLSSINKNCIFVRPLSKPPVE